jgi:hypothetical protein
MVPIQKKGFMVSYEIPKDGMLHSGYFPVKELGEILFRTEKRAWKAARKFAVKNYSTRVNIYVVDHNWCPVKNYKENYIVNREVIGRG